MTKVLIVDDDKGIAGICRLTLQLDGHEAVVVPDGIQALEQLRRDCLDLIILDLEMPVMDGRMFFKRIRSLPHRPPVLILSAYGARRAQEELGAEDCMEKPFDPSILARKVSQLVSRADNGGSAA